MNHTIEELLLRHEQVDLSDTERGEIANGLLGAVQLGADPGPLASLLSSEAQGARRTLTFVLSESAARTSEEVGWIGDLMSDQDEWIRHHAIVALQRSGSLEHPELVRSAIDALYDVRAVRLASVRLLAHGSLLQIETAVPLLQGRLRVAAEDLVAASGARIAEALNDPDLGVAQTGLATAFRAGWLGSSTHIQRRPELVDGWAWIDRRLMPRLKQ